MVVLIPLFNKLTAATSRLDLLLTSGRLQRVAMAIMVRATGLKTSGADHRGSNDLQIQAKKVDDIRKE